MSEPLDLEPYRRRDDELGEALLPAPTTKTVSLAAFRTCAKDRRELLAEVDWLRDEIADRANVEADLRAQLDRLAALNEGLRANFEIELEAQTADFLPHYFSDYCFHGDHHRCRPTCKVCDAPCLCECHATGGAS